MPACDRKGVRDDKRYASESTRRERRSWHPEPQVAETGAVARVLRRQAVWRWMAICLFLTLAQPGQAQIAAADEISPNTMQSGSLLLRMRSGYAIATRMNTDIEARVSGLAASVSVHQEFRNDGAEWVEGVYVFPLPDGAAVDRLRMTIGDRIIEGEIREKEQAKKAYEQAKSEGKKASLVEQQRANLFTTSVANIAPGEVVKVEIHYLETLRYDTGTFSLRFPLTVTPRYIPGAPLRGRKGTGWSADTDAVPDASLITPPVVTRSRDHRVTFHATIDAGVPLSYVASRYHPVDIDDVDGVYAIGLSDPNVPMDHDLELTWKPLTGREPRAMLFTETIEGRPHVLLMMLPPANLTDVALSIARELIFVIDTSGSMHGTSLEQAKRALTLALDGLRPNDQFNVIQFNSTTSALFPGSVSASTANLAIAKRYVAALKANGGTEMRPAIQRALATPSFDSHLRQVVFITDGSVGNEEELFLLIEQMLGDARLFTVGIGSAPNSWFMRKAAEAGRGTFTMISALHEVNEKMARLFRKVEAPQLTDVVVEWPSGNDVVAYPQKIADLYAGEPVVVKAKLASETRQGDLITIRGNAATGTWSAELPVDMSESAPGIGALWARARIEALLDTARGGTDEDKVRTEIIETALNHHLVSKYTSLVAIDRTPARSAGAALRREQIASLLPYGQSHQAIFGFAATATAAPLSRVLGMLLFVAAFVFFAATRRRSRDHVHRAAA